MKAGLLLSAAARELRGGGLWAAWRLRVEAWRRR